VLRRGYATEVKRSAAKAVINTSVVLNRAPFLTRTPTPFELAYYSYQQRIRRALSNPFPHEFYFKPGSLLETRFNMEERKREKRAFGPGFLPAETVSEEERLANEAAVEQLAQQEGEGEELAPRVHAADAGGDVKSLDRLGQRNLYLLVQTPEKQWLFPQGKAAGQDLALHQVCFRSSVLRILVHSYSQSAEKALFSQVGDKMDSWIVGRTPIGVYQPAETSDSEVSVPSLFLDQRLISCPDLYLFLQGSHLRWTGRRRRQGCHRLCMAHQGRNRASGDTALLVKHQGYAFRLLSIHTHPCTTPF